MVKFTVLEYNEFLLYQFGIFSTELSNRTSRYVFFKTLSSYYILLTTTAFVVASVIFVLENPSQFDVALRTSAIAIGTAESIGMYFCYGTKTTEVNAVHLKLQAIINETSQGICSFEMLTNYKKKIMIFFPFSNRTQIWGIR